MKIENSFSIDIETMKQRFSTGSASQRSLVFMELLDQITVEIQDELMKAREVDQQSRKAIILKLRQDNIDYLRNNPPPMPDFDMSAIEVFYKNKLFEHCLIYQRISL